MSSLPHPPPLLHVWVWVPDTYLASARRHFRDHKIVGSYGKQNPLHLLASNEALCACDTLQLQRLHYFFQYEGSSHITYSPPPHAPNVLRALSLQMSKALQDKNMGKWAALLQLRTSYLPLHSHTALSMARRLSHAHTWYTNVTPRGSIVYMVYHIFLHLIYIGVTTKALVVRLPKHHTDAASYQDCSTLHRMILQTDLFHWGILPFQ